jgi:DNA-directed RNA polymerase subunit RPC12/RpoP
MTQWGEAEVTHCTNCGNEMHTFKLITFCSDKWEYLQDLHYAVCSDCGEIFDFKTVTGMSKDSAESKSGMVKAMLKKYNFTSMKELRKSLNI